MQIGTEGVGLIVGVSVCARLCRYIYIYKYACVFCIYVRTHRNTYIQRDMYSYILRDGQIWREIGG